MSHQDGKPDSKRARTLCRSLVDPVNDVILIIDRESQLILEVNLRAVEVYGYSRKKLVGMSIQQLTQTPTDYAKRLLNPRVFSFEETHYTSTGEKLEFLVSISAIDFLGRSALLSINRDIRERKRYEAALKASEKKTRLLLQSIAEVVTLIDAEGRIKFIGPQVQNVLEYGPEEVRGKNIFEFIHPEDLERAQAEYARTVVETGEGPPSAIRLKSRSGEWVPFEIIANNQLHDPDVQGVIFTGRDLRYRHDAAEAIRRANAGREREVEERALELAKANAALRIENQQRRYTEKQLQSSVSLLNATLESTADGILVVSADGKISSYNQKFVDMWRLANLALAARTDEVLLAEAAPQLEDPKAFMEGVRGLYSNPESSSLDLLLLKDGRVFERYSQPQKVGNRIVGRVWSFRDVTEAKRLEEELLHSQKMQAVGRLAGGVAHDFNNLLMLISGSASELAQDAELSGKGKELSAQIVEATRRAGALTRQLLAFSRKQPAAPQVVDINRVVSDMEKMLSKLFNERFRIVIDLCSTPLPVYLDPSQLELVVMNLAINARDAMPDGGTVTIHTYEERLIGSKRAVASGLPAKYAVMEVMDTGQGMSEDVQARIFEPFYTTKGPGKGTGLGLSTVYGIVHQAGGQITVESALNQGSTFTVFIPKATGVQLEAVEKTRTQPLPVGGSETILLVEDEAGIRAMTRVYLESIGYKVLEAASGPEAIRIVQTYGDAIDLLLTDLLMPEIRGDDLVFLIRKDRPHIRALLMSGYA
ncbi:MAG TPA: PAS domain S-box protein, partial [Terriglobales bacterium]|nr:PAS domain S-box protein [Terriglobales bacterium]